MKIQLFNASAIQHKKRRMQSYPVLPIQPRNTQIVNASRRLSCRSHPARHKILVNEKQRRQLQGLIPPVALASNYYTDICVRVLF